MFRSSTAAASTASIGSICPSGNSPGSFPRVTIGRDSWIGDRSIVLADVGRHCVIGAGSVVTKPIPDYAIAVGNPARVIRFRNQELGFESGFGDRPK